MKNFVKLLAATLFVACTICAASAFQASAAETVEVTIPWFGILINGDVVDNVNAKYPCLFYKDITYIPMTYNNASALGLTINYSYENGLAIGRIETPPRKAEFEKGNTENAGQKAATVATGKITVNGKVIDNSAEQYPLLVFRDITYFPLTWRFAFEEFGWNYRFTNRIGLEISLDEQDMKDIIPEKTVPNACGDNLTWRFDESTHSLYIEGTGDMWDFVVWGGDYLFPYDNPWEANEYNLKNVGIASGVTSIGDWAFFNCESLESIKLPNSVTSIGNEAFYLCDALSDITIPNSVTSIGNRAFCGCYSLKRIHFTGTKAQWDALGLEPDDINNATVTFVE